MVNFGIIGGVGPWGFGGLSIYEDWISVPSVWGYSNDYNYDLFTAGAIVGTMGNAITDTDLSYRFWRGPLGYFLPFDAWFGLFMPFPFFSFGYNAAPQASSQSTQASSQPAYIPPPPFYPYPPAPAPTAAAESDKTAKAPAAKKESNGSSSIAYLKDNPPVGDYDEKGVKGKFYKIKEKIKTDLPDYVLVTTDKKVFAAKEDSPGKYTVVNPHKPIGSFRGGRDGTIVK